MNHSQAIGIFDSGIGGLTVAHEIANVLPDEKIIYFGDTKHLPYGDKSPEAIIRYSKQITRFLLQKKCKIIIIACNTASALAFDSVEQLCKDKAITINVIDPIVNYTANTNAKNVGIIGTKNTINSNVYASKIESLNTTIKTRSLASPLLVPMIEEGFYKNSISQTIINNYLSNPKITNIDHLILACTHYPLIESEIEKYYNNRITIINSAKLVAKSVKSIIEKNHIQSNKDQSCDHEFFVSDYTSSFEQSTTYFFGKKINLKEHTL